MTAIALQVIRSHNPAYPFLVVYVRAGVPLACHAPPAFAWLTVHRLVDGLRRLFKPDPERTLRSTDRRPDHSWLLHSIGVEFQACWLAPFWFMIQPLLQDGRSIRLSIVARSLVVLLLPWELLCWPDGRLAALQPGFCLRRVPWLRTVATEAALPVAAGVEKVLLAVAQASAVPDWSGADGLVQLQALLPGAATLQSHCLAQTTRQGLQEALHHFAPQVLCLSGACLLRGEQGFFVFADADGSAEVRSARELVQELGGAVPLLLLLGREEGHAPALAAMAALACGLVSGGVPAVVVLPGRVDDPGMTVFLKQFLHSLVEGASVEHALWCGRTAAWTRDEAALCPTWVLPVLFAGTTHSTSRYGEQHASFPIPKSDAHDPGSCDRLDFTATCPE
ncbi:MAG: CHAT domain-containing protein [Magnetococcales bacterium]|nr:CHAT domain-containing protein [Magnetococcales bacterium]MBF0114552.1 CHAT domain-containing protein [Magnetococcales bacterium]